MTNQATKPSNPTDYVTHQQLKEFGEQLTESIITGISSQLQDMMQIFHDDLNVIKQDIREPKADVAELKKDVAELKHTTERIEKRQIRDEERMDGHAARLHKLEGAALKPA